MRVVRRSVAIILLCGLGIVPRVSADDRREGMLFQLGAGGGLTSQKMSRPFDDDRNNDFGIGGKLSLGFGFTDQFVLMATSGFNVYRQDVGLDEDTFTSGNAVLEFRYYTAPSAPAVYFGAGAGLTYLLLPDIELSDSQIDSRTLTGFGVQGLIGYEFAPHWSLEATGGFGSPNAQLDDLELNNEFDELDFDMVTGLVTINYTMY